MTWNLLHLARMLKDAGGIPAHGNQRSEWDAGCRFDYPNPEHRPQASHLTRTSATRRRRAVAVGIHPQVAATGQGMSIVAEPAVARAGRHEAPGAAVGAGVQPSRAGKSVRRRRACTGGRRRAEVDPAIGRAPCGALLDRVGGRRCSTVFATSAGSVVVARIGSAASRSASSRDGRRARRTWPSAPPAACTNAWPLRARRTCAERRCCGRRARSASWSRKRHSMTAGSSVVLMMSRRSAPRGLDQRVEMAEREVLGVLGHGPAGPTPVITPVHASQPRCAARRGSSARFQFTTVLPSCGDAEDEVARVRPERVGEDLRGAGRSAGVTPSTP